MTLYGHANTIQEKERMTENSCLFLIGTKPKNCSIFGVAENYIKFERIRYYGKEDRETSQGVCQ